MTRRILSQSRLHGEGRWHSARNRSRIRMRWGLGLLALAVAVCTASLVSAQVPRVYGQGAAASGMGNAFAAQADDPSALHYNPAGMTQLRGVQMMAGGTLVGGTTDFRSPTGLSVTGDHDGAFAWPGPGHGYITANLQDLGVSWLGRMTVGVGVTTPFGSVMRWPDDSPFRALTTFTALPLFDVKPTLAYQLHPDFSIGVGADIYTFASSSVKAMLNCNPSRPSHHLLDWLLLEVNLNSTAKGQLLDSTSGHCTRHSGMETDNQWRISPWCTEARPHST